MAMPFADVLPGRFGLAARLPGRIGDLQGPVQGVILLPRNLSWPGMRECDVGDSPSRRSVYGMLLTQGKRNDIVRLVNPELLRQDWPLIRNSLDAGLRRWCERRLGLGRRGEDVAAAAAARSAAAAGSGEAAAGGAAASADGAGATARS